MQPDWTLWSNSTEDWTVNLNKDHLLYLDSSNIVLWEYEKSKILYEAL